MINLPIFRAKKLDSNEYVEGFLYQEIKYAIIIRNR